MTEAVELQERSYHEPPTTDVLPGSNQSFEAIKDIAFGSVAGIIGKFVEYPFDTVKVRLQSQSDHLPLRYTGPLDCFKQSFRSEGIHGLYRGISAPLLGAAIETSSLFFSYRIAQKVLQGTISPSKNDTQLSLIALAACGGASGAFTSLLLTPIELIKCQMQIPAEANPSRGVGPISIITLVYRHHGLLGFWHGQLGTLIRETGGSAAWFGSYESMSALFRNYSQRNLLSTIDGVFTPLPLPIWQQLFAGAVAGVSYNFIFYPADTIKSRMQTGEISQAVIGKQKTFWNVGQTLWHKQGIRGLYRGCGITVARAAPSSAFIFVVYEGLRNWFG